MSDVGKNLVRVAGGALVERDVLNIVERLHHYDPALRVKYLAVDGSVTDAPYALFELCPDGFERLVFHIWELDERVLEKLYQADTFCHDILANLDKKNQEAKKAEQRRYREEQDEVKDIVEHIIKSPKGSYSFKDKDRKVTVDTHLPAKVEALDGD